METNRQTPAERQWGRYGGRNRRSTGVSEPHPDGEEVQRLGEQQTVRHTHTHTSDWLNVNWQITEASVAGSPHLCSRRENTHTFTQPSVTESDLYTRISLLPRLHRCLLLLRGKLSLTKRPWSRRQPPAGTDEDKQREERKPSWLSVILRRCLELARVCRPLVSTVSKYQILYYFRFVSSFKPFI